MVDNNNNQWEDMEYTDNTEEDQAYSYDDNTETVDDYSDQSEQLDEGNYDESYDEYDEEDDEEPPKKSNPLPVIIIFLLLLGAAAFFAIPKFMGNNAESVSDNQANQNVGFEQNDANSQSSGELADSFFDAAGGENSDMMSVNFNDNGAANVMTGEGENAQVATVTESQPSDIASGNDLFANQDNASETGQENNAIMVVYNKAARMNPFKPPIIEKTEDAPYEIIDNTQFEIIEPPTASVPDENLTRLLQTQISGILYDDESPSAIVNLNGLDQFVKIGDTISGYKIENITRDKVQISYKNNSYVASVGELFTRGSLEKQAAIVNLENKFAGRYKNNN